MQTIFKIVKDNVIILRKILRKMERIVIFIENSNIFKGFQKYGIQADYEKLKNIITRGYALS